MPVNQNCDEEHSEMLYTSALKRVLWGDNRDEILKELEVNGFSSTEALEFYNRAFQERVEAIRSG